MTTELCEYQRCGGLGQRITKVRRRAVYELETDAKTWRACEGWTDLLIRDLSENDEWFEKRLIAAG